jgi:hypothetical protein
MIIAVPSIIEKERDDFTFIFAVLPPIVTLKNANERVRKIISKLATTLDLEEACKEEVKLCYPLIFGGVFIFNRDVIIKRYEVNGYLCNGTKENVKTVNQLINSLENNIEWCFRFSDNDILCYSKNKIASIECKWIDNIGLRFIMDTL